MSTADTTSPKTQVVLVRKSATITALTPEGCRAAYNELLNWAKKFHPYHIQFEQFTKDCGNEHRLALSMIVPLEYAQQHFPHIHLIGYLTWKTGKSARWLIFPKCRIPELNK